MAEGKIDALGDAVIGFIEAGHTQRAAAALTGIPPERISDWLAKGQSDIADGKLSTPYAKFVTRMAQAKGRAQSKVENALYAAAIRGNVTAMLAWLRARATKDWSEKQTIRVEGQVGVTQSLEASSDSELRQMVAEAMDTATKFLQ